MKSQEFLAKKKVSIASRTSTRQQVYTEADARSLLKGIDRLVSGKGKKVVTVDLRKTKPVWSELAPLMLGPTGNLRAPVIRVGSTLVIGFNDDMYREHLT